MRKYFLQYINHWTTNRGSCCNRNWQQGWHTQKLKMLPFQNFKTSLKKRENIKSKYCILAEKKNRIKKSSSTTKSHFSKNIYPHLTIYLFNSNHLVVTIKSELNWLSFPAGNYMFKVNNRNNRARCEISSNLTINALERSLFLSFLGLYR